MAVLSDDMGGITAYAAAVNRGYTGTKEEFEQLMYSYTEVAERAEAAAGNAHESEEASIEAKDIAVGAKNEAVSARDAAVSARDSSISAKNDSESARDAAISAKNDTLAAKDAVMSAKGSVDETSANFSDAVTAAISDVNAAGRNQKELAKTHAIDSEAWAVGQREGADVGVSDETYHNNSKYYAEQSALAKSETETARDTAITAKDAAEQAKVDTQEIADGIQEQYDQIQINKDDISDLKEDFTAKITTTYGKNRNTGNDSDGYLDASGILTPNNDWKTTDYCYIGDLEKIIVSGTLLSNNTRSSFVMFYACTYNTNKEFIANIGRTEVPYTVGDGVAYIRFAYHPTYAKEIQVESGAVATAYVPYTAPSYSFVKSPYVDEYYIDYFNIYNPENNIAGSYVNSSGEIALSSNATRCKIPVSKGDVVSICRLTSGSYPSGAGRLAVCDASDNILVAVDMSQYATIKYGNQTAVKYEIVSDNAAYITFNVKMSSWDETNTTVVTLRDINTEYNGNYISKIEGYKLMPMDWKNGKWQGKKWVVVGDSLTKLDSRTSKYYYDYIASDTAIDVYNMGDSGSGYAAEQDGGTAFYQRISNVPTDADVITIFGSFNDLDSDVGLPLGTATDTGTTTIGGCINATFDALNTAYPLAIFGVISPTPWGSYNPTNEPNLGSQYCDLLKQICDNRSIPYLDLFHASLLRPWESDFLPLAYSKDGGNSIHPDETGHKIIAPRIKAFLESLLM